MIMGLGSVVRVKGFGNYRYQVVGVSSPVRSGEWIVRKSGGSMLSVKPECLNEVSGKER
jgi:hypothetical protein